MENNATISQRPIPALDELNAELYGKMATIAAWTAPCTFARTEKAPIDSKSVFETYDDLVAYINDAVYGTAYPGQLVAVTSNNDQARGAYVLATQQVEVPSEEEGGESTFETRLVPIRLGTSQEIESASASAVMNWLDQNGHEI